MAPLTEPAFARLRSVDPVLAEAAGDAAFELETDLFAALAKGIMEKGASDAFPFAWASLAAQIGEVSPERVLEAGSALEAFGKKTANALLGAAKAVRSGKSGMERLAALPGTREAGAVSYALHYYARPPVLFPVQPGSFYPPPKVPSAVLRLSPPPAPPDRSARPALRRARWPWP